MPLFSKKIRTRFAPSPTGYMHVGNLRSALYEYLFAKQNKGIFFIRLEDTDQSREVAGAAENILKVLKIAGIEPDEGICLKEGKLAEKGHFGPYTQSQRLNLYQKYANQLVKAGLAYYCFCTEERLELLRKDQEAAKLPTRYDFHCRSLLPEEVQKRLDQGDKYVIRMKVPENREIEFEDMVRGKIKVNSREIDDQIILKADGFPTYHLAHAVDDHLMETTHVIRGEEWLPSTPKHILLFEALGWEPPIYAHLPMILNTDRTKLSKRQGDVAVEDYLAKGYLPEALLNFISLLGWNPGTEKELFTLDELIKEFSFAKVHKAGAVFDVKKLDWMNGEYIKKLENKIFVQAAMPFFEKFLTDNNFTIPAYLEANFDKALLLEQQRISRLAEVGEGIRFLLTENLGYDPAKLVWKKSDAAKAKEILNLLINDISGYAETDFTKENFENKLKDFITRNNLANGDVLWPLRVALTGADKSPAPFEVAEILGKEATLSRLRQAIEKL